MIITSGCVSIGSFNLRKKMFHILKLPVAVSKVFRKRSLLGRNIFTKTSEQLWCFEKFDCVTCVHWFLKLCIFPPSCLLRNNPTCHDNHVNGAKDGNEGKQCSDDRVKIPLDGVLLATTTENFSIIMEIMCTQVITSVSSGWGVTRNKTT